ncbi:MAG: 30S ribosomal protein S15 [Bacteroidetes bacterium]|nr:30S ribosomal protein S15 [Bacteroidota bacterium]
MIYRDNRQNGTRQEIIKAHGRNQTDSGSPEVQIALFTGRITDLTNHLATNKKDFRTQRALMKLVSKRKRLLEYLNGKDYNRYNAILEKLNLRK